MKNKNAPLFISLLIALLFFLLISVSYEYYILYDYWRSHDVGALIRVDIFIVYPVFLGLTIGVFWLFKRYLKKMII